MGLKCIEFTDGTQLAVFALNDVWDDSITLGANEVQTYSQVNALVTGGDPAGGFVNDNLNGKSFTDKDGNVWTFARATAGTLRCSIALTDGTFYTKDLARTYSGNSNCWMHFLACNEISEDGKYALVWGSRRAIDASARQTTGATRYIRCSYVNGDGRGHDFYEDVALVNPNDGYSNCVLRNVVPGSPFVSLIGLRVGRANESTEFIARDYYTDPYGQGQQSEQFLWLSENAISDYVEPPADDDPYSGIDGEGEISGGGSGVVGIPGFPGLTASAAGVIGLFAPSAAQMQALSDYMWTDFGGTGTTTDEILGEIVQALKRSISNPLDYVVGLNIIPSQGLSIGGSSTIRFGFTSSGVSMPRLSNQYFAVNCGSLSFAPVCGNTFLDYAPYSKFSIYLPYIGVKEVDANDFVGHTIGVTYHGDVVTGGVTAYITKDGSVIYQYSGCCALNVPLSADGWGSTIAGAVQIATSMVAAFGGGAAGVATAAAEGAASVAANPSLLSPQVSHSGAVSGGAGCMGVQYPFVIRETVRFHSTSHFNELSGYPSFYYRLLSNVEGYTKVLDVHLNSIPATAEEITEIETLLKRGVIL